MAYQEARGVLCGHEGDTITNSVTVSLMSALLFQWSLATARGDMCRRSAVFFVPFVHGPPAPGNMIFGQLQQF